MTFQIGDTVRVLPPFDVAWPGEWIITGINPDTGAHQINGGKDFAPEYLEKVT